MSNHTTYLSRCINLAKLAGKNTKANPMVGAVLVYGDRIIGEGYHQKFGEAHAEVNCLKAVKPEHKSLISQSTLYVSLEPCCIERKTPACTKLILENKIPHVVVGCLDPNKDVNGLGVKMMENEGIKVDVIHDAACETLISKFKANLQKRPYIILKWAQTCDNFMGHKGKQVWISNAYSMVFAHKLRTEVDGILIGKNTAIIDNPQLNARYYSGDDPMRIVLDEKLELDAKLRLLNDEQACLIINGIKDEQISNKHFIKVSDIRDIEEVLHVIYDNGIFSLLVEGGKSVLDWFIKKNKWDEAYVIKSKNRMLSDYNERELITSPLLNGKLNEQYNLGEDEIIHFLS